MWRNRSALLFLAPIKLSSIIVVVVSLLALASPARAQQYTRHSEPELLTYRELVALSEDKEPEPALARKVQLLTTTPFIDNQAFYRGAKPFNLKSVKLGPYLRVVFWNIERGLELDEIKLAFGNRQEFLRRMSEAKKGKDKAKNEAELLTELETLETADVIVLNELDMGMKRTGYRNVIEELGKALNMNWSYGVEFIEVSPTVLGTEKFGEIEEEKERRELEAQTAVDPRRLRGLHGSAILSRYPIKAARLIPFRLQGYDWYQGEKKISALEKGKRKAAEIIGEKLTQELRRGGRMMLIAELDVPQLAEKRLTVVCTHLENRTAPKNRRKQMEEVLDAVRSVRNPLVIAGDMNTSMSDSAPVDAKRLLMKRFGSSEFWATQAIKWATGIGLGYDVMKSGFKLGLHQSDPTTKDVPFIAPNKEQQFFTLLEDFRFEDGTAIDFRGDANRTINGTEKTLANSNQRDGKGFAQTLEIERAGALGKYKLDWFFVKSYLKKPRDESGPYIFAPHFSRTMTRINGALAKPLSDHHPISVDLPFEEPGGIGKQQQARKIVH
jgi:endonuclease/exonuclease/phosphatase family metal-dependent hydrolase